MKTACTTTLTGDDRGGVRQIAPSYPSFRGWVGEPKINGSCTELRCYNGENCGLYGQRGGISPVKERQRKLESQQFLNGWKEIARYLGKGVRTTQRYERTLGLPVRRPAGKPSGSVIATKAELDAWVKASPIREIFHLRNLQPEYDLQAKTLKSRMSEMGQLRDQMLALRLEVRRTVALLHGSICELRDTLRVRTLPGSSLYSNQEEKLLKRSDLASDTVLARFPKAS